MGTFITCAVTGGADTVSRHPRIPVTPKEIADAAISAAKAGAAIVHLHARDPKTGQQSRDPELFTEIVSLIRDSDTDVIINVSCGMAGDLILTDTPETQPAGAGTDLLGPRGRLQHLDRLCRDPRLKPEICTLDCGSMNFGDGDLVYLAPATYLRPMAQHIRSLGIKPELEVFELGHLAFVQKMSAEGLLDGAPLIQFCLGIPGGAPAEPFILDAFKQLAPTGSVWSAFAIGRDELRFVSLAAGQGGNVRVGLEDNLYLEKGVFADNDTLVERAVGLIRGMGGSVMNAADTRQKLGLDRAH
ncbi:3-keto-5-aminohexanoate cleavage protein (plasmid) [Sinorhizobium garamanticum]|uniref:3-keto-5-aminohexanoate cleavage protein n=1 Tax=Sinorhizobium garamanticum TaxID=680247 RepID=A0ABY8DQ10_9HYPH|nr:3-keto-5-aminohexanoate cleavage protein [Sinorhizobium garamanticum]WEX91645.1 3-keto-5-aminohexanoate cleavage protein [Sinorhizobium garamanticum]